MDFKNVRFRYRDKIYQLSSLDETPLDIEKTLTMIDEGKVPAIPEYSPSLFQKLATCLTTDQMRNELDKFHKEIGFMEN